MRTALPAAAPPSMTWRAIPPPRNSSPPNSPRHFVSDAPPPQLVARLEKIFRDTQGDLKALAVAMVEDPSAWTPGAQKMRNPVEYVTASYRLLDLPRAQNAEQQIQGRDAGLPHDGAFPACRAVAERLVGHVRGLVGTRRHPVAHRMGAGTWASRLPQNIGAGQIARLADQALGEGLSQQTRSAIAAAPTGGEALALLVSSPEFQRR